MGKAAHVRVTLTSIVVEFDNMTLFSVPLRIWERIEQEGANRWRSRCRSASEVKMIVSRLKAAVHDATEKSLNKQLLRTKITESPPHQKSDVATMASDIDELPNEMSHSSPSELSQKLPGRTADQRVDTQLTKVLKRYRTAPKESSFQPSYWYNGRIPQTEPGVARR